MKVFVELSVEEMQNIIGEASTNIGIYPVYCLHGVENVKEQSFIIPRSEDQKDLFIKNLNEMNINSFLITDEGGETNGNPHLFKIEAKPTQILKTCSRDNSKELIYYLFEAEDGNTMLMYLENQQKENYQNSFNKLLDYLKTKFRIDESSTIDMFKTKEQMEIMSFKGSEEYLDYMLCCRSKTYRKDIYRLTNLMFAYIQRFPEAWD